MPLALAAGVNGRLPALISLTEMNWPAVTATLLLVSVPLVGSVVIFTANRMLAGPGGRRRVSLGSVKPKSAAVKT